MINKLLKLFIFSFLSNGLYAKNSGMDLNSTDSTLIHKLKIQKATLDSLFWNNLDDVVVFVKVRGVNKPIKVDSLNWPENIEITYNIFIDSNKNIDLISEYLQSDTLNKVSYLHRRYYFNNKGKCFSYEQVRQFYGVDCTDDGQLFESIYEYYDDSFSIVDYARIEQDIFEGFLKTKECNLLVWKPKRIKDLNQYFKENKIKNYR